MGAQQFEQYGHGTDARDAFAAARESAAWEHGHGGYTGTLAEKPGFVMFTLPPRWKAVEFVEAAWAAEWEHAQRSYPQPKRTALLTDWEKKARRLVKRFDAATTADFRARLFRVMREKWDEAAAVEVSPAEATAYKAAHGLKGSRAKVFYFFGMASS